MSLGIFLAVLAGAMLHAVWNAIIKGGREKLFEAVMKTMGGGVGVLPVLFFLPLPAPESWPYLAASCTIHLLYYSFLSLTYKYTDMSYGYTIMRGTAPLMTACMLALGFGMALNGGGWAGILLLTGGILLLGVDAGRRGNFSLLGTVMALGNAVVIMGYTLSDGFGARASGAPVSYVCWLMFINAFPMTLMVNARYGRRFRDYVRERWPYGLVGGLASLGAYGTAVWAMAYAPMALVAALRETSVIFGLLLAVVFLKEKVTLARVAAIALVAAGSVCMKVLA